jgi:hypothetical protein
MQGAYSRGFKPDEHVKYCRSGVRTSGRTLTSRQSDVAYSRVCPDICCSISVVFECILFVFRPFSHLLTPRIYKPWLPARASNTDRRTLLLAIMKSENIFQTSGAPWQMAPAISRATLYVIAALSITILVLHAIYAYVTTEDKSCFAPEPLSLSATFTSHIRNHFLCHFRLRYPSIFPEALSTFWSHRGFLERLPPRKACRPNTTSTIQPCQHDRLAPIERSSALSSTIRDIATTYPQLTYLGRSTFDTRNNAAALFSRRQTCGGTKYFGEICRSYPEDGSVHLKLHPADVKMVIESGWGKQHPQAMSNWWNCFTGVSTGDTLIYAPRSQQELMVVTEIIRAAMWWVGKQDSESGS